MHSSPAKPTTFTHHIRIVGIGDFGRLVVRQVQRTVKNARCLFVNQPSELTENPRIAEILGRADGVFLVADVRDSVARAVIDTLVAEVIGKNALRMILTCDFSDPGQGEAQAAPASFGDLPCTCLAVSALSLNPLQEDVLSRFGIEMVATWLICRFVEMFLRLIRVPSDAGADFLKIKVVLGQGGVMRLGNGMSSKGDVGEALRLALESLTRQGVDVPRCRGVFGWVSAATKQIVDDHLEVTGTLYRCKDEEGQILIGRFVNDALLLKKQVVLLYG